MLAHTFNPNIWESHAFNSSTKEVETEIWLDGEEYNMEGDRSSDAILRVQFEDS